MIGAMAIDGLVGAQQESHRTQTASMSGGGRSTRASQLRAARQRAARAQAEGVTHWLRRLALEEEAARASSGGAGASAGESPSRLAIVSDPSTRDS